MKVRIPNPCPENLNNMPVSGKGRYCSTCTKVVRDYTQMNKEEFAEAILRDKNTGAC